MYYCELCKFNLPPHDDVEQQLSLHCRNRVHLQRYVQHCEKTKSREKMSDMVCKQIKEETKSDSDSSNKVLIIQINILMKPFDLYLNYICRVLKMKTKMMLLTTEMIQM